MENLERRPTPYTAKIAHQRSSGAPNESFWRGARVLVTGHTGFKGGWISLWLEHLGAKVTGVSLPPEHPDCLFYAAQIGQTLDHRICDLRDAEKLARIVKQTQPQIVLHLAAQSLVRRSLKNPAATFAVNVGGTVNLLEALSACAELKAILVATSDKVYANDGSGRAFREADPLGGGDPYSASKAACEHAAHAYRGAVFAARNVGLGTARAGNVIGGGDYADDRIATDCVRAAQMHEPVSLRAPQSTRPWQHVLDCAAGYLRYAEDLAQSPDAPPALNFGPQAQEGATVLELAKSFAAHLGGPAPIAGANTAQHEAPRLAIDAAYARARLNLVEHFPGERAIQEAARWYADAQTGADMAARSRADIENYHNFSPAHEAHSQPEAI